MSGSFEEEDHRTFCERRHVVRGDVRLENLNRAMPQELLLREMQHRMANSLQIVAGILLLKARTVKSKDSRLHLLDAYGRIMAVAAMQRQLLESRRQLSMIRLDHYLTELGKKLTESLTDKVSLSVAVQGSATIESNKAMAIGLIVTELVINALRHAFPGNRHGNIDVTCNATVSGWSLLVSDNGLGHANASESTARAGYGTKIIEALAEQLDAYLEVNSGPKGTRISLTHAVKGPVNRS